MMVLPFAIASSDMVAALPRRIALRLAAVCNLTIFELPIKTKPWMVSMLWSTLSDQDEANRWLRNAIKVISQKIETSTDKI
jgi:DNA-binding transcriptional LysR family regulator